MSSRGRPVRLVPCIAVRCCGLSPFSFSPPALSQRSSACGRVSSTLERRRSHSCSSHRRHSMNVQDLARSVQPTRRGYTRAETTTAQATRAQATVAPLHTHPEANSKELFIEKERERRKGRQRLDGGDDDDNGAQCRRKPEERKRQIKVKFFHATKKGGGDGDG